MALLDMVFLPVDVKTAMSASKQRLGEFIPEAPTKARNFLEA
jgi:hypothetical protein